MINDDALLEYFYRGLIPGPEESEEAFLARVQQAKPLAHPEWDDIALPFKIDWVPITYSNHKIAWWEGAATWISQTELPVYTNNLKNREFDKKGPQNFCSERATIAERQGASENNNSEVNPTQSKPDSSSCLCIIQLRKNFEKGSFLGYKRSEVLSHEAIHAARMRFEEPLFEEVLAYSTAPQAWKRFLGPLFSRTWEPLVLMVGVALGIFWPLVPVLMVGLSLGRLGYRQWIFKKCCRKLSFPVVLTLTDREMKQFASMTEEEIQAYLEKDSTLLFRVRKICQNNPKNRSEPFTGIGSGL